MSIRTASPSSASAHVSALGTVLSAAFAILLGGFFVYGVGFASPGLLHNAAHDGRHAMSFPCH